MVKTNYVMVEVEELSALVESLDLDLGDLPDALEARDVAAVRESLETDEDDKEAISKWFTHYEDDEMVPSEVEAISVYNKDETVEYVIVRSEMRSSRKKQVDDNDDRTYHAVWVVGRDDSIVQKYFIHRVEWRSSFEKSLDDIDNPLEAVRQWLGFSEYLSTDSAGIEKGTWHQVQGDIAIQLKPYQDEINAKAAQQAKSRTVELKHKLAGDWIEENSELNELDGFIVSQGHRNTNVMVKRDDTESLKELQSELDISEEAIRDKMDDNWEKLTVKRRKELIRRIMRRRINDFTIERSPETESLTATLLDEIEEDVKGRARQLNIIVGNHIFMFEKAADNSAPQGAEASVILPEKGQVHIVHDEHSNMSLTLGPAVVNIKLLNRHAQA